MRQKSALFYKTSTFVLCCLFTRKSRILRNPVEQHIRMGRKKKCDVQGGSFMMFYELFEHACVYFSVSVNGIEFMNLQ